VIAKCTCPIERDHLSVTKLPVKSLKPGSATVRTSRRQADPNTAADIS
jgi:hypothetical protein